MYEESAAVRGYVNAWIHPRVVAGASIDMGTSTRVDPRATRILMELEKLSAGHIVCSYFFDLGESWLKEGQKPGTCPSKKPKLLC